MTLSKQMMVSVAAAIVLGAVFGEVSWAAYPLKEMGAMFIGLLKMVVVPIAFISITGAIVKLGGGKKTCGMTADAFIQMILMSACGVVLGLLVMYLIGVPSFDLVEGAAKEAKAPTILGFILSAIPVNPVESFAKGNMLQVITFSFFTGAAILYLDERERISRIFDILQKICITMTGFVIRLAPIGVFCLLYPIAAKSFAHVVLGYVAMITALVIGSLIYMAAVCLPVLHESGVNSWQYFKTIIVQDVIGAISGGATNYMAPRIENLKENTNIPHEVIDYLIPLTAVLMRAGSCICVGIYTVFAANVYGVALTPEKIIVTVFLTIIALTAAPGIIGGTLMDCAIVWAAIGIPLEAIAILAGIDYVMDVLRTVLNIQGGEVVTACVRSRKKEAEA